MESFWQQYQERRQQSVGPRGRAADMERGEKIQLSLLGLVGELGEATEHIKKVMYHDRPLDIEAFILELGDILWYVQNLASALNIRLETCITPGQQEYKPAFTALLEISMAVGKLVYKCYRVESCGQAARFNANGEIFFTDFGSSINSDLQVICDRLQVLSQLSGCDLEAIALANEVKIDTRNRQAISESAPKVRA